MLSTASSASSVRFEARYFRISNLVCSAGHRSRQLTSNAS